MCPWFVHNETQFQPFNYLYCLLLMPFMWYILNAEWWMNRHVWVRARMCASVCIHFWTRSSDDKTKCSKKIPCDISILLNTTLSKLVSQLFDLLRAVVLLYIVGIILYSVGIHTSANENSISVCFHVDAKNTISLLK